MGVLDAIDGATPLRRTVEVILDGELEDEWFRLRAQLSDAAENDVRVATAGKGASLARPATTAIVGRMEEIRDAVTASRIFFVFERIDWAERIALRVDHPPRKGNQIDGQQGFNVETYTPVIIQRACLGGRDTEDVDVELTEIPADRWVRLLGGRDPEGRKVKGTLNFGQVNRLFGAAHVVNEGESRIPTSARFLLESQDSGASLAQPGPGTSRRSASRGGSRRTSPRSSTTRKAASSAS